MARKLPFLSVQSQSIVVLACFVALCPPTLANTFTGRVERVILSSDGPASTERFGRKEEHVGHTFTGVVSRVIDGDTIVVLTHDSEVGGSSVALRAMEDKRRSDPAVAGCLRQVGGRKSEAGLVIVRLAEIDAPEMKTPHGPASKAVLADMILHKQVVVTWKRRGRYRRIIGQVYADGEWVNLSMVAQGWAWQFRRYSRSRELAAAEREARSRKVGFWQAAQHSALAVAAAGEVQEMIRGR